VRAAGRGEGPAAGDLTAYEVELAILGHSSTGTKE